MKITKLLAAFALTILAGGVFTSCLDTKEQSQTVSQIYSGYFNAILNNATGEMDYYPGVSYTLDWDITNKQVTIQLAGLKLPNGSTYPTLRFNEVPWTINPRGWQDIALANYTPEGIGSYTQAPVFNTFKFVTVARYIENMFFPCVSINYDLDGVYTIFSLPQEFIEIGETVVTDKATGAVYKPDTQTEAIIYVIKLDVVKKLASVTISGAKFASNMPAMNLRFSDIPFVVTTKGDLQMELDKLTPSMLTGASISTATETPMPAFPITDFKLTYDPDRGIWVSYNCSVNTEQTKGTYGVTMINQYPDQIQ